MLHRRQALTLLAAFAALSGASAHGQGWAVFQREGVDFTVELPGTPKVEEITHENGSPFKSIELELEFDGLSIGASQTELPTDTPPMPPEQWLDAARNQFALAMGVPVLAERRFMLRGFHANDVSYGSEKLFWLTRLVVSANRFYQVNFSGPARLDEHPTAARVLRSFTLLRVASP